MSTRTKIAVAVAAIVTVLGMVALMAPYLALWDPAGEAFVSHADAVPEAATGEFVPPGGAVDGFYAHAYTTYVSARSIDGVGPSHSVVLSLAEGLATGAEYVSSNVVITEARYRLPIDGMHYPRVLASCIGSATFDGTAWTLAFSDAACAPANGRYTRWTEPVAPVRVPTSAAAPWPGACSAYADCACGLAAQNAEVFGPGCAEAQSLLASGVDDPAECAAALTMMRSLAPSLGLSVPARCSAP